MGQRESHNIFVERRHTIAPCAKTDSKQHSSTMSLNRRRSLKLFRNSYSIDPELGKLRHSMNEDHGTYTLSEEERVNVNTSSEEQLMTLPGVNRSMAKAIVERRHLVGKFGAFEDLANVPGMDKKTLDRISLEASASEAVKNSPSPHASMDSVFEAEKK